MVLLSGCAPWGTRKQEVMLDAAGFRGRRPQTPMQQGMYDSAPSYQLLHGKVNGENFYAYKDRAKGLAYIGGPTDYQRYKELAHQESLGQVDYVGKEMTGQMATGWHDAWTGKTGLAAGPLQDTGSEESYPSRP
jgi:hypothetical protein